MTNSQINFINMIAPLIKEEAEARGYNVCSTVIAQAICESNWGKSKLSLSPHYNFFGLKAGSQWLKEGKPAVNMKTKEEYTVGKLTTINDYFRSFPGGVKDGVKGYYDFISTNRYANLKIARNYIEYAQFLKQDGYATSSSYVNTLCTIVKQYDLTKYDLSETQKPTLPKEVIDAVTTIAQYIINVKNSVFGNGPQRKENLYRVIQDKINELMG